MIKFENIEVVGLSAAIRGMRNPKNSWERSDSKYIIIDDTYPTKCRYKIGENDHDLMMRLSGGGPVHAKYRRMIVVYVDITAPLYWWKEFDTYKVGTVANSCSTMHKIHDKYFELNDFSHEHLTKKGENALEMIIEVLNDYRAIFNTTQDKEAWWQMIQLLPTSYNQKRTIMLNYEVLNNIYFSRKGHKLDEWHSFCDMIKTLPYSEVIIGEEEKLK